MTILSETRPKAVPVVIIGIPTFGMVSMKWHVQLVDMLRLGKPMNRAVAEMTVIGDTVAEARNKIVADALAWRGAHGAQMSHVFFLDDDVFVQRDTLIRLLAHDRDIVSALYYAKTHVPQPLLFAEPYAGPAHAFLEPPIEPALVDCYAHGMGCTLIRREVFEAIDPPWFKTGFGEVDAEGEHVTHTEDTFFLEKARAAGYAPAVDTGHIVPHYDHVTGDIFPSWLRKRECVA